MKIRLTPRPKTKYILKLEEWPITEVEANRQMKFSAVVTFVAVSLLVLGLFLWKWLSG